MKKAAPQYRQDSRAHGKSITVTTAKKSSWMKPDREFFKKNPRRSYRLRPLLPGELEHIAAHTGSNIPWTHVIIQQIEPGLRCRHPLPWPHFWDEFAHSETFLSLLWGELVSGAGVIPLDLMEKAREIDRAAAACAGAGVLQ